MTRKNSDSTTPARSFGLPALLLGLLLLRTPAVADPINPGQPASNGSINAQYLQSSAEKAAGFLPYGAISRTDKACEPPCIQDGKVYLPSSQSIHDFGNAEWLMAVAIVKKSGSAGFSLGPISIGAKKGSEKANLVRTLGIYRIISGEVDIAQYDEDGKPVRDADGKVLFSPEYAEVYYGAGLEMTVDIYARSREANFGASLSGIAAQASVGNVNAAARFRIISVMDEEIIKLLPQGIDVTVDNLAKISKAFDDMQATIYKPDPTSTATLEELKKLSESADAAFLLATTRSGEADSAASTAAEAAKADPTNLLKQEAALKAAETAAQFKTELASAQQKKATANRAYLLKQQHGIGSVGDRYIKPEVLWIRFPHRPLPTGK